MDNLVSPCLTEKSKKGWDYSSVGEGLEQDLGAHQTNVKQNPFLLCMTYLMKIGTQLRFFFKKGFEEENICLSISCLFKSSVQF